MTSSAFRMTVPELERQQRGRGITADSINQRVDALNELTRGVGAPRMYQPEGAGGGGEPVGVVAQIGFVIITAASGTGDTITVSSVIRTASDGYETVGESYDALVWPGHVADDFAPLITHADQVAKVVPIVTVNGDKYVVQQFRWDVVIPNDRLTRTDCRIGVAP